MDIGKFDIAKFESLINSELDEIRSDISRIIKESKLRTKRLNSILFSILLIVCSIGLGICGSIAILQEEMPTFESICVIVLSGFINIIIGTFLTDLWRKEVDY